MKESVHRRSSEYADYENWQDALTLNSVSCVPTHVHGRSAEEEAELVPDEEEFDTTDVDNKTADANLVMAITANAPFEEREKSTTERYNSKSGYKLRTFLSTPSIIKSQKAFALRRTPSYEPEGYNEYGEAEYDEEFQKESPLHINGQPHLSSPVDLKRTLSTRRKKSSSNKKKMRGKSSTGEEGEDRSTVASMNCDLI